MLKTILISLVVCAGFFGCKKKAENVAIKPTPTPTPAPLFADAPDPFLPKEGLDMIIYYESGGEGYYNKVLKYPTVPPGASGVTIGVGFDLQFYSKDNIIRVWEPLGKSKTERLSLASGLNHTKSKEYLPKVKDILVTWGLAYDVFSEESVPTYYNLALRTFPGLDKLCPNAQAAVTSIVFNRGASLTGPTRSEMRDLKTAIAKKDYKAMSDATLSMKRLWVGKGMDGLLKRRDAESKLILTCLKS